MRRCVLLTAITLLLGAPGCGGGAKCDKACEHWQTCRSDTPCPLTAACTPVENCKANCLLNASCDDITGANASGAQALQSCTQKCPATVVPTGGDSCEQAFNKQKSCAASLNCATLPEGERALCEMAKQMLGELSYSELVQLCEQETPGECQCSGERALEAQRFLGCDLDQTCNCPE